MKKHLYFILSICSLLFVCSCEKSIEVDAPIGKIEEKQVFEDGSGAISAMTGVYYSMSEMDASIIGLYLGLSADEFKLENSEYDDHYLNKINPRNSSTSGLIWTRYYSGVFRINVVLEALKQSEKLHESLKNQLVGEALFVRAFHYFYLTNLFGDVPLVTSSDYKNNIQLSKTSSNDIYKFILQDLEEARMVLSRDFLDNKATIGSTSRLRPTYWSATALLARVYFYLERWADAERLSSEVIESGKFKLLEDLDAVFLKDSEEAIWQLQPIGDLTKTIEARTYILTMGPGFDKPVSISNDLYDSFDVSDKRRLNWIGIDNSLGSPYYFPHKYKNESFDAIPTEYSMVLRLSEQYLIRGESRARLGKIQGDNGGLSDLNKIHLRAGLTPLASDNLDVILYMFELERRHELFSEWGDRWLDLKRTKRVDAVMSVYTPIKGGTWKTSNQLYPIPTWDIEKNQNLLPQNSGY